MYTPCVVMIQKVIQTAIPGPESRLKAKRKTAERRRRRRRPPRPDPAHAERPRCRANGRKSHVVLPGLENKLKSCFCVTMSSNMRSMTCRVWVVFQPVSGHPCQYPFNLISPDGPSSWAFPRNNTPNGWSLLGPENERCSH